MKIKRVRLHNIRSYTDCTIDFNEGATLLAGDVGAGKSSVLLAMDFALFGITRQLSGNTLLRNGANSGYVELELDVGSKNVSIKRSLARGKGIVQDEGSIIVDGTTTRCSAMELKQQVLSLLNYPKDLLTKSKGLIYRYTVYTPQEEIKKILQEEDEVRIDTLRRIFGIDKYKRIRENTGIFTNSLREKARAFASYASDIEIKKKDLDDYSENETRLKNELDLLKPRIDEIKTRLENERRILSELEAKIKELSKAKNDLDVNLSKAKYLKNEEAALEADIKSINEKINAYGIVVSDAKENITEIIKQEKQGLDAAEKQYREMLNQISFARAGMQSSNDLMDKVSRLDTCPVCKQAVSAEHKHGIKTEENAKISEHEKRLKEFSQKAADLEIGIKFIKEKIESLNIEMQKTEMNKLKAKNLEEMNSRKETLSKKYLEVLNSLKALDGSIDSSKKKLELFGNAELDYAAKKSDFEKYDQILRELEVKHSAVNARFFDNKKIIAMLENDVKNKLDARAKSQSLEKTRSWLNDVFVEMVNVMEKKVMSRVHSDFNELFQKWFNVIMSDDGLAVSLDPEFNPVIEQNGYNIEYLNLSGGEKTAIALAYRLALNQVINNLVVEIKTNDLIVLDEPTDGFSDEQVSRIKQVLDELNIKQVIVVSHEPRIESFVDSVIRIKKDNHVSYVA